MIDSVQIIAGARHGGAELFYERFALALHAAGDPTLAVIRTDPARAARLRAGGLAPVQLRFGAALDRVTPWRLRRVLARAQPRIAMAWMGRAAAATPAGPWTRVARLGGYYDLRRFQGFDHLVGNTRALADWMIGQGIPPARVHHLPNFAPDLSGMAPADRASLGIPPGPRLILGLGRLHTVKGFDTLLRALAVIPHAHCLIAGEGPERAALLRLAHSLGVAARLSLPGWHPQSGALLAAADLFVCPSRHEPLGNTILEAWSASRPVVAAAAAGPSELIRDRVDGLLVPIDDPAALARAIRAVLADPHAAEQLAAAGRQRFLTGHAQAPVLAQWREFLHGLP